MLVICDIDGTLLDLRGFHGHARGKLQAARELWGLQADLDDYLQLPPWGLTDRLIMLHLTQRQGLTEPSAALLDQWQQRSLQLYQELEESLEQQVFPGVHQGLQELRAAGHRLVLGTGNLEPIAWLKLQRAGLAEYFQGGGFGSDAYRRDELIRVACGRSGYEPDPQQVAYVGDTPLDVQAARAVGVRAVGVTSGRFSAAELGEADLVLEGFHQLAAALDQISPSSASSELRR